MSRRDGSQDVILGFAMRLRLVAIVAACQNELAAGVRFPSDDLRMLAATVGLQGKTLDDLRIEAKRKLEAAFAGVCA